MALVVLVAPRHSLPSEDAWLNRDSAALAPGLCRPVRL